MKVPTTDAASAALTDAELMRIEGKAEVINGEIVALPSGLEQEKIGVRLITRLATYVEQHDLGEVYGSSAGYRPPDMELRSPDVSFVRKDRLPDGQTPRGFGFFAPDLAVEILAPDETAGDYKEKIREYFEWGVQLVWLINPNHRTITVYKSQTEWAILTERDSLSGDSIVPGFLCEITELF